MISNFSKRKISNAWLRSALGISLILTGISTPALGAGPLKVLETTATVSSVQNSGEIWRALIPTSVVLNQGESYGDLEFPIEGKLAHSVLADRSLGVDVEFELWSSSGKKIASDSIRSYDWNPVGPNTLVSMTIFKSNLSANATYTLLIRTVYNISTTGLLSRYLEDKKTMNFKIVEAKLPSQVTQTNTAYSFYEIGNALDATSYEIGIEFTNSNLTIKDCTQVPESSYLPAVVIKTVTSQKFTLTQEEVYESAKRLGASLKTPYNVTVRGVNQFGAGEWANGNCFNAVAIPVLTPEAKSSSSKESELPVVEVPNAPTLRDGGWKGRILNLKFSKVISNPPVTKYQLKISSLLKPTLSPCSDCFSPRITLLESTENNFVVAKKELLRYFASGYATIGSPYILLEVVAVNSNGNSELSNGFWFKISNWELQPYSKQVFTITCAKGNVTKKVSGVNPKCPAGYKKK